jgi:hypothetical protein
LTEDGAQLLGCGAARIAEVDLMVAAARMAAGSRDGLVEADDRGALVGVGADMQQLIAASDGEYSSDYRTRRTD